MVAAVVVALGAVVAHSVSLSAVVMSHEGVWCAPSDAKKGTIVSNARAIRLRRRRRVPCCVVHRPTGATEMGEDERGDGGGGVAVATGGELVASPTCFVCESSGTRPVHALCDCTDRYVHTVCICRVIETVRSHGDGICPVCRVPYRKVTLRTTRRVRVGFPYMLLVSLYATAHGTVGTVVYFLVAYRPGTNMTMALSAILVPLALVPIVMHGVVRLRSGERLLRTERVVRAHASVDEEKRAWATPGV